MLIAEDVATSPRSGRVRRRRSNRRASVPDLVTQLVLKTLHLSGELPGTELARRLGLPFTCLRAGSRPNQAAASLRDPGGALGSGSSVIASLMPAGRGPCSSWSTTTTWATHPCRSSSIAGTWTDFQRRHLRHVVGGPCAAGVLTPGDQRSRHRPAGPRDQRRTLDVRVRPPGNGKTVISQAIHNLLEGSTSTSRTRLKSKAASSGFFDPVNHEPLPDPFAAIDSICRRLRSPLGPLQAADGHGGGRASLDQLELSYSPAMGFYRAPVQAVANGGVLVIDDFGRQTCSPKELLNRWIVPLESRIDFLALQTGQKFNFPFMTMIVFATNIKPQDLVDEAFLRRIHYKIFAESPTRAEFLEIFEKCCREKGLEYRPDVIEHLLATYYKPRQIQLRGCQPRDLISQVISLAEYLGEPPAAVARLARSGLCRAISSTIAKRPDPTRTLSATHGCGARQLSADRFHLAASPNLTETMLSVSRHCLLLLTASWLGAWRSAGARQDPALSVRITSPFGSNWSARNGPDRRAGASPPDVVPGQVRFYVDQRLLGTVTNGPPYATEWVDENPFERREISVEVSDALATRPHDHVILEPFEIADAAEVNSVLIEASVQDRAGPFREGPAAGAVHRPGNDVPQTLDIVRQEAVGATFALMVDSSASMSRRMDFVQRRAALGCWPRLGDAAFCSCDDRPAPDGSASGAPGGEPTDVGERHHRVLIVRACRGLETTTGDGGVAAPAATRRHRDLEAVVAAVVPGDGVVAGISVEGTALAGNDNAQLEPDGSLVCGGGGGGGPGGGSRTS